MGPSQLLLNLLGEGLCLCQYLKCYTFTVYELDHSNFYAPRMGSSFYTFTCSNIGMCVPIIHVVLQRFLIANHIIFL